MWCHKGKEYSGLNGETELPKAPTKMEVWKGFKQYFPPYLYVLSTAAKEDGRGDVSQGASPDALHVFE